MDNRGYVMSAMSLLLVLPAIMLLIVFLDMTSTGIEENSRVIGSDSVLTTANDFKSNIIVTGKEVLKSEAESVVDSGTPLSNSRAAIKTHLQAKVDQMAQDYQDTTGMEVECNITSVGNSEDPFSVRVNSTVYVAKGDVNHREFTSQDISITDPHYPILNSLPFMKCKDHGEVQSVDGKIAFGYSLVNYLESRGVENAFAYENSTTAYIIKKCPYDPYIMHDTRNTIKNCIENGYFHESADGPCFLCRLEGKGICPHYGMETFVVPNCSTNTSLNSSNLTINLTFNTAPSSIDHVIFDDITNNTYPGERLNYYFDGINEFIIYLDNAHRQKYGFPMV